MGKPVVGAGMFEGFAPFASRLGLDFGTLLADAGINPQDLSRNDNDISLNAAASLLDNAARQANAPCLGLNWAQSFPVGGTGVLAFLLMNATNIREALNVLAKYAELHMRPLQASYDEDGDYGTLTWRFPASFTAPRTQYACFLLAITIIRLRTLSHSDWMPTAVELEHRALPCTQDVERVLGPNVRYDRPRNSFTLHKTILDRVSVHANPRLFKIVQEAGDRALALRSTRGDVGENLRRAIIDRLQTGDVRLDTVASHLELAPRTLQAKLAAESTTFENVLNETRIGMAEHYLRDTDLSLADIALLLGFSEHSAFTRASQRWFEMSPSAFRQMSRK